ncbi:MAG: hypothetical protein QOE49_5723 [Rhodospirillaceae bacterium]|nr:hypothetical protein [Rhodospirillaceae bacterium]
MSSLVALAGRCLREPASRRLDGEIYCALHNIKDINDLSDHNRLEAKMVKSWWSISAAPDGDGYRRRLSPESCATPKRLCPRVWRRSPGIREEYVQQR